MVRARSLAHAPVEPPGPVVFRALGPAPLGISLGELRGCVSAGPSAPSPIRRGELWGWADIEPTVRATSWLTVCGPRGGAANCHKGS